MSMLSDQCLEDLLARFPGLTIAVVGDLFLDRYFDLNSDLTEPSLETGLDAYQVTNVRNCPGAAGTVINNLAALGVGRIVPITVIGDDGEGYELRRALHRLSAVDTRSIVQDSRRTPTYMKPMLHVSGQLPRELNRLDIKNRTRLSNEVEQRLLNRLHANWPTADAVIVLDQVSEPDCGVITGRVREWLGQAAEANPEKFTLADSRERIGLFRSLCLKPNQQECLRAVHGENARDTDLHSSAIELARRAGRAVFCTQGAAGILLVPSRDGERVQPIPAYPVAGPIDPVGAGDSTSAGLAAAVAAGATLAEGAAFGNLVASITVQQLGTTGTATPSQIRERWRQVQ